MYRSALRLRRGHDLGTGTLRWHEEAARRSCRSLVDRCRSPATSAVEAVPLPAGAELLLSSSPEFDGRVGTDMCVWWVDGDHGS